MRRVSVFAFRSAFGHLPVGHGRGQIRLTGIVVALSRQSWAPALRGRSGRAIELQEVEPAAAAVHRVDDAVGGHVDVVDLGRAGARARRRRRTKAATSAGWNGL